MATVALLPTLLVAAVAGAAATCTQCGGATAEQLRAQKLQVARVKILAHLGLHERPNVSVNADDMPTGLVRRMVDSSKQPADAAQHADHSADHYFIVGGVPSSGSGITYQCMHESRIASCFQFSINYSELTDRDIESAHLLVHAKLRDVADSSQFALNEMVADSGAPQRAFRLMSNRTSRLLPDNWLEFDLTERVQQWRNESSDGPRVLQVWPQLLCRDSQARQVVCLSCGNAPLAPFDGAHGEAPTLHVALRRRRAGRQRRSRPTAHCNVATACCLRHFVINFTEIGWDDWIIQPKAFEANYCVGTCARQFVGSQHAKLLLEAASERDMAPCCAPQRMESLKLVYVVGEHDVRVQAIPNMRVLQCGC